MDDPDAELPIIVKKDAKAYGAFLCDNEVRLEVDDKHGLMEVKPHLEEASSTYQEMEFQPSHDGEDKLRKQITRSFRRLIPRPDNYDSWGNEKSNSDASDFSSGSSNEIYSLKSTTRSSPKSPFRRSSTAGLFPDKILTWKLVICFVISIVFMVVEFVGGRLSSSLTVYADASRIFCESMGISISAITLLYNNTRTINLEINFSFYKSEILGSLSCVLLVWFTSGFFLYAAIIRVISDDYVINSDVMVIISLIGFIVNGLISIILHGCGCCGRGTTHDVRSGFISYSRNLNIRVAAVYIARDLVTSLGIFVGAILIKHNPSYKIVDPIMTIIFCGITLGSTLPNLWDVFCVLFRGNLRNGLYSHVFQSLRNLPGITDVQGLQIWPLDFDKFGLVVHLFIDPICSSEEILLMVQSLLREKYNVVQSTIQTEANQTKLRPSSSPRQTIPV